jgi:hypothetical protein
MNGRQLQAKCYQQDSTFVWITVENVATRCVTGVTQSMPNETQMITRFRSACFPLKGESTSTVHTPNQCA